MAIERGAGSEILRSNLFEQIDNTTTTLIIGQQHHIYTVIVVNIACVSLQAITNKFQLWIQGYDSKAGDDAQPITILHKVIPSNSTFVWDDKFSFPGGHPVDFSSPPLNTAAEQDLLADQGRSIGDGLYATSAGANDDFDVMVAYIDQNNS